jgi:hypothetical protein
MKVSVLSMFRDSEDYLPETLKNLDVLEDNSSYEMEYFFYENDSRDNTVPLLKEWLAHKKGDLLTQKLDKPKFSQSPAVERQLDMTHYRNQLLDLARPLDSKYSIILDSDVHFDADIVDKYLSLFRDDKLSSVVMITPNVLQNIKCKMFDDSKNSYYDSFALIDRVGNHGMTWACNPFFNVEDRERWENNQVVYVNSAFGGCPIIKSEVLNEVRWSTDGGCEHWNFCRDVRVHGDIVVAPTVEVSVELSQDVIDSIGESNIRSIVAHQHQKFDLLQNF